MKIAELLQPAAINDDLKATGKKEILAELTDGILAVENGLDRSEVIQVLQERENLGSTGIGDSVAIPHGKLRNMDGKPAHLFFLLIAPEESVGIHLKTLARISKLLKDSSVRSKLMDAADSEEIYRIIVEEEEKL